MAAFAKWSSDVSVVQPAVEAGVADGEMVGEPVAQAGGEIFDLVGVGSVLVGVHEIAHVVEQGFVVVLVPWVVVVLLLTHDLFFEREMGRDAGIDLAQIVSDFLGVTAGFEAFENAVEDVDELAVL